jgi:hypothetical protein
VWQLYFPRNRALDAVAATGGTGAVPTLQIWSARSCGVPAGLDTGGSRQYELEMAPGDQYNLRDTSIMIGNLD